MNKLYPFLIVLFVAIGCAAPSSREKVSDAPDTKPTVKAPANAKERIAFAEEILNRKEPNLAELSEAERHLQSIDQKAPEYKEVSKLTAVLNKARADLKKRNEERLEKNDREAVVNSKEKRKEAIAELEQRLLKQGMDFYFSFGGKNDEVLTVKYILMSRPIVHNIVNETEFLSNMRAVGVRKVIFTDGYDDSWTYTP